MTSTKHRGTPIKALDLKNNPSANDLVLAEDSQNNFSKIAIPISAIGGGGVQTKRIDIVDTSFSATSAYPIELLLGSRLKSRFNYIFENHEQYALYSKLIFWEFLTASNTLYTDLRFDTIADANNFINTTVISDAGTIINEAFIIRIYLRELQGNQYSNNKIVNYNGLMSKLKTRNQLQNRKVCTLHNSTDTGFSHPLIEQFIDTIYNDWIGVSISYSDAQRTIGFPSRYEKIYNLIPTKYARGKKYVFPPVNPTGKRVYEVDTGNVILFEDAPINQTLYYYDSIVIKENTDNASFTSLGLNPKISEIWDSYSAVRVYRLVDNILNPRYYYFMLKPIGVDQFILPYVPSYTDGTFLRSGVMWFNKKGMLKVQTDVGSFESEINYNANRLFRIRKDQLTLLANHSIRNNYARKGDELGFRFFVFDEATGYCLPFSEQFTVQFKVAGTPVKIMPNGTIRNDS